MKHVDSWLNENEYKRFVKRAEKMGITPYALTKHLILKELHNEAQKDVCMTIAFWFICYALIAASIVIFVV